MTRHVVRFIMSVALLFGSLHAAAQVEPVGGWFSRTGTDRGTYLCQPVLVPCENQGLNEGPAGHNGIMIESVINDGLSDHIWRKNDYFTICNPPDDKGAVTCTTFTWIGVAGWVASGNPTSPPGGYHGDTAKPRGMRSADSYSPNCGTRAVMQGHYEWYDYYSDGVYIGSGDVSWVIDQVSVFHQCV